MAPGALPEQSRPLTLHPGALSCASAPRRRCWRPPEPTGKLPALRMAQARAAPRPVVPRRQEPPLRPALRVPEMVGSVLRSMVLVAVPSPPSAELV